MNFSLQGLSILGLILIIARLMEASREIEFLKVVEVDWLGQFEDLTQGDRSILKQDIHIFIGKLDVFLPTSKMLYSQRSPSSHALNERLSTSDRCQLSGLDVLRMTRTQERHSLNLIRVVAGWKLLTEARDSVRGSQRFVT